MSNEDYSGYRKSEISGLPNKAGRYFLITTKDELVYAELRLSDGIRSWNCYTAGGPISDDVIRMWKKIVDTFDPDELF